MHYLYQKGEGGNAWEPSKPELNKEFLAHPLKCSVSHYLPHFLTLFLSLLVFKGLKCL
jgi:hypothetical protein